MMQVNADLEFRHAFVVGAAEIGAIWRILELRIGSTKCTGSCSDGIERTFASLEELTSYENPKSKQIKSLVLSARDQASTKSGRIRFRDTPVLAGIGVTLEGPEDDVSAAMVAVGDIVAGCKPWFSFISRVDLLLVVLALGFLGSLFLQLLVPGPSSRQALRPGKALIGVLIAVAILSALGTLAWLLLRLQRRFFPMGSFLIGQGHRRYKFDETLRWVVLVGFLVSALGSVFASLVTGSPNPSVERTATAQDAVPPLTS